jgi:hypothetical protein
MRKLFFLNFLFLFLSYHAKSQEKITISGYLKDPTSKEVLLFAQVMILEIGKGVITNEYGYFSIEVPIRDSYTLQFSSPEFNLTTQVISGKTSISGDFFVKPIETMEEVVVTAKRSQGADLIQNTEVSTIRMNMKEVKMLPAIGGETDVLKVAQLLPGINRGTEGGTNFFVRGGDGDQNLILVDEATVYNPGHLFGFFSVFNPDVIKEMTIYKGGFPSVYSGRLSSITDIRTIDGDKSKYHVNGGIGMLSSRLLVEGPLWKDKASFMIAGRRSYIDKVFKLVGQDIPFYFYDLNGKINVNLNDNNKLFFSSYFGNDVLKLQGQDGEGDSTNAFGFGYKLGNFTQTIRWSHIFNPKLFGNLSLIHTQFKYDINGSFADNNILIKSAVEDYGVKYDMQLYKNSETKINYGIQVTNHQFRPNVVSTSGEISEYLQNKEGALLSTVETNAYYSIKHTINSRWKVDGGMSIPLSFVKNKAYSGISPRGNLAFQINEKQAVKFSVSRMYQFMHRVSSSSFALPTDLWYPISEKIKPQIADQIALAYNINIPKLKSYVVIEGYYKYMQNLTEYKEGSQIILNDAFEDLLIQGNGWSSGAEFLLKKDEGKITGWVGYTMAWTKRRFEELNGGNPFWAKYDRRHYLTVVGVYNINKRLSFSAIFEYSTGARFTPIIGQYMLPNAGLTGVDIIPIFAERNSYKMSNSHRLDLNFVIKSKPTKKYASEWHLGGYNVYNRATPFQIQLTQGKDGAMKYTQPGLFGFIPSIGYNFKF